MGLALATAAMFGVVLCPVGVGLAAVSDTTISTIAGTGAGTSSGDGGPASAAGLNGPRGLATDRAGNIYIADTSSNRIRRIDPSGLITTFAGNGSASLLGDGGPATAARLSAPSGVAVDAVGNVLVADSGNNRIRRIDVDGKITTVAGTGTLGFSGDGGPATAAKLATPRGVVADLSGDVYVADATNNRIRRVDSSGEITTVAGTGAAGFTGDGGPATAATLSKPTSVALGPAGLYVADATNSRVRYVDNNGVITTFAGGGSSLGDGGPATAASLSLSNVTTTSAVAVNPNGDVLITDTNHHRSRAVSPDGRISTLAGSGNAGFSGDGGPAVAANLNSPMGVTIDDQGRVLVADSANNRIRVLAPPPLGINDVSVDEGNSGTTTATLAVTVVPHTNAFTVDYATADGTATVTDHDYVPTSGTLSFGPGELRKSVTVQVVGDVDPEVDEAFSVHLTHSPFPNVVGTVTIRNDDGPVPTLSIADTRVLEGDSGTAVASFTVTKSGTTSRSVTVDYATTDGTATAPADYLSTSGTVELAPSETTTTISIPVVGDELQEADETFSVKLSNPKDAVMADQFDLVPGPPGASPQTVHRIFDHATATIIDNDSPGWTTTRPLDSCNSLSDSCLPRDRQTATLLDAPACHGALPPAWCGEVLVAGGRLAILHSAPVQAALVATESAELYNPTAATWTPTAPMHIARQLHTATLLADGRVLVVGGIANDRDSHGLQESEIYDPAAGTWTVTSPPSIRRVRHTATLLDDGTVLIAGGAPTEADIPPVTSVELFDPASGTWRHCNASDASKGCPAPLPEPRALSAAVRLADGHVLIAGGVGPIPGDTKLQPLSTAVLFDPATGQWSHAASMAFQRPVVYAALLDVPPCGDKCDLVLVAGGTDSASAEFYDPVADAWTPAPLPTTGTSGLYNAVFDNRGGFTKMADGDVLLVSYQDGVSNVYDPVQNDWMPTHNDAGTYLAFAATPLDGPPCRAPAPPSYCGAVLVTGGGGSALSNVATIYTPGPKVRALSPSGGPSIGGPKVLITGSGFSGATVVKFGDLAAADLQVESPTQITATAPSQPSGPVEVSVRTPAGGTSRHFPADLSVPFIYSVSQAPAAVADLSAHATSDSKLFLSWSAPASDGTYPPPAGSFIVKISRNPITTEAAFEAAPALCKGRCEFNAPSIGAPLGLSVDGLQAGTTYHFALRALNEASQSGPLSNQAGATTRGNPPTAPTTAPATSSTTTPILAVAAPTTTAAVPTSPDPIPAPLASARSPARAPSPVVSVTPSQPVTTTSTVALPTTTVPGGSALGQSVSVSPVLDVRDVTPNWAWALLALSIFANLAVAGALLNRRIRPGGMSG